MFEFTDCVKYLPWIGEAYNDGFNGTRILVIGDSHYGKAPGKECDFTCDVLQMHLSGKQRISFFTNIARAITGVPNDELDQEEFWKCVAFYNYVQESVEEARSRPTAEQGVSAQVTFEEIINKLQPDKIIMLGNFVWDMTPSSGYEGESVCSDVTDKRMRTWHYPIESGKIIFTGKMEHPSSGGFSGDAWHPVVKKFLECEN
ncbi:MAG: hypothetical protein RW306_19845 [Geobacteraceae bacterium]|nr:hypothetical protein [Geobacteraceae bacterium]